MLGHPSIQRYSLAVVSKGAAVDSDNPSGADNQQETAEVVAGSSETAREAPLAG